MNFIFCCYIYSINHPQIHLSSLPLVRNWLTPSLPLSSNIIYGPSLEFQISSGAYFALWVGQVLVSHLSLATRSALALSSLNFLCFISERLHKWYRHPRDALKLLCPSNFASCSDFTKSISCVMRASWSLTLENHLTRATSTCLSLPILLNLTPH